MIVSILGSASDGQSAFLALVSLSFTPFWLAGLPGSPTTATNQKSHLKSFEHTSMTVIVILTHTTYHFKYLTGRGTRHRV